MIYHDTVTHFAALGELSHKATYAKPHVLRSVKYEDTEATIRRKGGDVSACKAMLYVPIPLANDLDLKVGDIITLGVVENIADAPSRRITSVEPKALLGHLHHLEVTLS